MATARTVTAPGPSLTSTRSAASTRASSMSRLGVRVAPVRSVRGAAGDSSPGAPIAALSRASCSSLKRGTLLSGVVELCSIVVARRSTNGVAMNSFPPSAPAVAATRPAHRAAGKKSLLDSVADPGRRRWWGLAALCLGALLVGIDNTIVNVALPTIGRDLNASISDLQWVVDGYTLVFATLLLLAGHLGDRFGRRRLLLIGLAVFAATSIAASFATSTPALIAGRAAMGIGAAMIFPATLALLVALFPDRRQRAAAIGVWSGVTGLSVALVTIAGLAGSVAALAAFVWWEVRRPDPLFDVTLFADARFSAASGAIAAAFFGLFGFIFLITQYFQVVRGYGVLEAGVATLPFAVVIGSLSPVAILGMKRFGTTAVVAAGLALMSAGFVLAAGSAVDSAYWGRIVISMVLMAAGLAFTSGPATEAIMGALPASRTGAGSAVNDTTREIGGTLGVAIAGSVMNSVYGSALVQSLSGTPVPPAAIAAASRSVTGGFQVAALLPPAEAGAVVTATSDAFVSGLSAGSWVAAGATAIAAVAVLLFLPARHRDEVDGQHARPDSARAGAAAGRHAVHVTSPGQPVSTHAPRTPAVPDRR